MVVFNVFPWHVGGQSRWQPDAFRDSTILLLCGHVPLSPGWGYALGAVDPSAAGSHFDMPTNVGYRLGVRAGGGVRWCPRQPVDRWTTGVKSY